MASKTIDNLITAAQMEASLAGQYSLDMTVLKYQDVKWVSRFIKGMYKDAECWLRGDIMERLCQLGASVKYQADAVVYNDSVAAILDLAIGNETAVAEFAETAGAAAMDEGDRHTAHLFDHLQKRTDRHVGELKAQRALVTKLDEANYIGSRLSDG